MSLLDEFKVPCPKCGAGRGHHCVVATGKRQGRPLDQFHAARLSAFVAAYRVTLWHCPTHGLTTEIDEHPGNGWESDIRCRVSMATTPDADHCDERVNGPFFATLDDGAAVALAPPSLPALPHAGPGEYEPPTVQSIPETPTHTDENPGGEGVDAAGTRGQIKP